jgi:hypothetical protein
LKGDIRNKRSITNFNKRQKKNEHFRKVLKKILMALLSQELAILEFLSNHHELKTKQRSRINL